MSLTGETKAFVFLRNGEFEKTLQQVDEILSREKDNFWAWYLGSVAQGHLDDRNSMAHYLEQAEKIQPEAVPIIYMRAYVALLDDDLEKALWEWTKLTQNREGWLAVRLLEKARSGGNLVQEAREGRISEFIVLPDFFNDLEKKMIQEADPATPPVPMLEGSEDFPPKRNRKFRDFFPRLPVTISSRSGIKIIIIVLLAGLSGFLFFQRENILGLLDSGEKNGKPESMQIDDYAHIYRKSPAIVQYNTRKELIDDFNKARELLGKGKINQSRYLAMKILHSNADFRTMEKVKIFLKFIPVPHYRDFDDSISFQDIISEPSLYVDALVLHDAEIIELKERENGLELKLNLQSKEKDEKYIAYAFYPMNSSTLDKIDRFKKDFREKKIIIYGKFKGTMGSQKLPYIEILRLWI